MLKFGGSTNPNILKQFISCNFDNLARTRTVKLSLSSHDQIQLIGNSKILIGSFCILANTSQINEKNEVSFKNLILRNIIPTPFVLVKNHCK